MKQSHGSSLPAQVEILTPISLENLLIFFVFWVWTGPFTSSYFIWQKNRLNHHSCHHTKQGARPYGSYSSQDKMYQSGKTRDMVLQNCCTVGGKLGVFKGVQMELSTQGKQAETHSLGVNSKLQFKFMEAKWGRGQHRLIAMTARRIRGQIQPWLRRLKSK